MTHDRAAVLITDANAEYAGGEFYVLELARSLRARGYAVWVSCMPSNLLAAKCAAEGIPVEPVAFPASGGLVRTVRALRRIIRQHRISIVHTNTNYDRTVGAIAARLTGARHVTNIHSFHSIQHNLTHWLRNRYGVDRFITDGGRVRELLVHEDRIPAEKISVIPLGVDPSVMRRQEDARRRIRAELGVPDAAPLVGNVARLVPFKGHEVLLEAFARMAGGSPQARLLVVGSGERDAELRELARTLGVGARVIFAGFRDDLPAVYSGLDIYAHASVEGGGETFPFAVLQALAQELPVVVTRVGDVAEMVLDGESGFTVADRDAETFAAKLALLAADPALRKAMGRRGYEHFLGHFTTERMVGRITDVYRGLAA